jgi:hypothetical protein
MNTDVMFSMAMLNIAQSLPMATKKRLRGRKCGTNENL